MPFALKKRLSLSTLHAALEVHDARTRIITPSYHNPTGPRTTNADQAMNGGRCPNVVPYDARE